MRTAREPKLSPMMQRAVDELKALVKEQYPEATFRAARNPEEYRSIDLLATVDLDETDEVMDLVLDRVLQFQLEEHLPVHVIPLRTPERDAALRRELAAERRLRDSPLAQQLESAIATLKVSAGAQALLQEAMQLSGKSPEAILSEGLTLARLYEETQSRGGRLLRECGGAVEEATV